MGSPISPLLANIFMDNLENKIFDSIFSKHIIFWYRYVDDILACFNCSIELINDFLNFINNLHNNIKFTLEKEVNRQINFLDLEIKINNQNKIEYSIYRKPSCTDITIPQNSCHHQTHKLAAFRSMVHRAMTIPLNIDNFNKEISVIKQIAFRNGFNTNIIDKLIYRKEYKIIIDKIYPCINKKEENKTIKLVSIPYFGKISENIAKIINKTNKFKVVFKSQNNILNHLFNGKDKLENIIKSGVYKLNCTFCNAIYIGKTIRNFDIRYKEHISCYKHKHINKSNFAKHLLENNHKLTPQNNITFLQFCSDKNKLDIWEAFKIYKYNKIVPLMNEQIDLLDSPILNIFD